MPTLSSLGRMPSRKDAFNCDESNAAPYGRLVARIISDELVTAGRAEGGGGIMLAGSDPEATGSNGGGATNDADAGVAEEGMVR